MQASKPVQFRFHKHLATSRYDEFLNESDDEEFFGSKAQTKEGHDFELDFKIDAYRDQIKLSKHGSQRKLIAPRLTSTACPLPEEESKGGGAVGQFLLSQNPSVQ